MKSLIRRLLGRPSPTPPTEPSAAPRGRGWRVLVFRYNEPPREELHVLAPLNGDEFDWDLLREHTGSKSWPPFRHEPGRATGVIDWLGHHTYVVPDSGNEMRLKFGNLVPGEFGGGAATRSVTLVAIRDAGF